MFGPGDMTERVKQDILKPLQLPDKVGMPDLIKSLSQINKQCAKTVSPAEAGGSVVDDAYKLMHG